MRAEKWHLIQERAIALTGRCVEDLSEAEATDFAESLTPEEALWVVERRFKPQSTRQRTTSVTQNELVKYRSCVKNIRTHQARLCELRARIVLKPEKGARVQSGIFSASMVQIQKRGGKTVTQLRVV